MTNKKIGLTIVFTWFFLGGIGHFVAPDFFLNIVPPGLPLRIEAVYVSGFFELAGALALLHRNLGEQPASACARCASPSRPPTLTCGCIPTCFRAILLSLHLPFMLAGIDLVGNAARRQGAAENLA
jgi:hypothetical protein